MLQRHDDQPSTDHGELHLEDVTTLLWDADGTLFPSEEPAFEASATVVNQAMSELGVPVNLTGDELRRAASGRNFRSLVVDLAQAHRRSWNQQALDEWVAREVDVVTEHLSRTMRPDPRVRETLRALSRRFRHALVSSSALRRLDVCLVATGLADLFPDEMRFSAQDSLTPPTSKPDPAVYRHAGEALGLGGGQGLAIEDAVAGVASARGAGFPVIGTVAFVPPTERRARAGDLGAAGAVVVVDDWHQLRHVAGPAFRPGPSRATR